MFVRQTNRSSKSNLYTLPSPILGLNQKDSLEQLQETEAVQMDNYYPSDNFVELRKGYVSYALLNEHIETLVQYKKSGNNRFLAFGGKEAFDITNPNEIHAFEKNYLNAQFQYAQFKDRLILVNGRDTPQSFYVNESAENVLEDAVFTGENLIPEKLINVSVSKKRLFFVEKGSLNAWYSQNVGEVQGNLIKMDLSTIFRKGGELMAVASWTQDGGAGIDDLTVFLSSEGEVLVYSGSNPSSADDWALKGSYLISPLLGYRSILEYQGDLVLLTQEGFLPLSKALPLNQANTSLVAFSDKIRKTILQRTRENANKKGWEALLYPRGGFALFNVPNALQYEQYVINTQSGAWCRFCDIYALSWSIFEGRLYFGSKSGVYLFDEGYTDNGQEIKGVIKQGASLFGTRQIKRVQLLNIKTKSFTTYSLNLTLETDFSEGKTYQFKEVGNKPRTKWNSPWNSPWSSLSQKVNSKWIPCSALGGRIGVCFETRTKGNSIKWLETSFRYEKGEGLLSC